MSEIFMTTHCYIRYALEIPSYINMKITVSLNKSSHFIQAISGLNHVMEQSIWLNNEWHGLKIISHYYISKKDSEELINIKVYTDIFYETLVHF